MESLRVLSDKAGKKLTSLIESEDGKILGGPDGFKKFGMGVIATILVVFLGYKAIVKKVTENSGLETYLESEKNDGNIRKDNTDKIKDSKIEFKEDYKNKSPLLGGIDPLALSNLTPSLSECEALLEKMKKGSTLNGLEKKTMQDCLNENVLGLTKDQIDAVNKLLNDPNLSDAARALLNKLINGDIKKGDELYDLVKKISSVDPVEAEAARRLIDNQTGLSDAALAKLKDFLEKGNPLNERNLISALSGDDELKRKLAEEILKARESGDKEGAELLNKLLEKGIESLSPEELAKLKEYLKKNNPELYEKLFGKEEKDLLNKALKNGIDSLTPEELEKLKEYLKKNNPALYKKLFGDLPQKKIVLKVPKEEKVIYVDENGNKLSPDQIRYLKEQMRKLGKNLDGTPIKRKKRRKTVIGNTRSNFGSMDDSFTAEDSFTAGLGKKITGLKEGEFYDVSARITSSAPQEEGPDLLSNMSILGILLHDIKITDKTVGSMPVRVRVLKDVYSARTNKVYITKGSIAIGTISGSSFDKDTGIATVAISKIEVGSKIIPVSMNIASGNGLVGLQGAVMQNNTSKLIGTAISTFSAGFLKTISEISAASFINSADLQTGMLSAGTGAASDVASEIADQFSEELKNSATVYYVPAKTPIVLYPN